VGKINATDKTVFENQQKKIKYGNKRNFYINIHLKDTSDRIHSLLKLSALPLASARGSADNIYHI